LLALALVVVLSWPLASGSSSAQEPASGAPAARQRTISVAGNGQVSARPDTVVVRLGVETRAEGAAEALAQNSEQMQALIDALGEAGIAKEDIQTQAVQLYPIYEQPQPEPQATEPSTQTMQLVAYQALNVVEVESQDLEGLGALLDTTVEVGGNRIESIRFEIRDVATFLDQAREAAWQDARYKAEQLAELAGVQLGDVLTIVEMSSTPLPYAQERAARADTAVPIEPGTQNVQLNIQVTWELTGTASTP